MINIKESNIYKILRGIYYFLKSLDHRFVIFYETKLSIFIFYILRPFVFLLEKVFEIKNYVFIINISDGFGHLVEELDYLYKFKKNNKLFFKNKKVFWISKKTSLFCEFETLYSDNFNFMKIKLSNILFYLMLPIFYTNNKKILFDCGLGQQSYDLSDRKFNFKLDSIVRTGVRMRSRNQYLKKCIDAKNLYGNKKPSFFEKNFSKNDTSKLLKQLNIKKNRKIVLLHINDRKINMSAKPTDPLTFLTLINYLKRNNYEIIFIGREKIPKLFKNLKIVNYANSVHANFKNDILLFKIAEFSIITASGLHLIPLYLNKKFLLINNWSFPEIMGHKKSLQWPALIKKGKNYISLNKQKDIYFKSLKLNHSRVPDGYNVKNIENNELLIAFKELEKKSKLINNTNKNLSFIKNYCKFPNSFNKKYRHLLYD